MRLLRNILTLVLTGGVTLAGINDVRPVWPPAPDPARVVWVGEIAFDQLKPATGLFGSIVRAIGGSTEQDRLSLPFDIVAEGGKLFAVCQNLPALVEIDRQNGSFKLHRDENHPFIYPVALCDGGSGRVFVSDAEAGAVYLYESGKIRPFITSGLGRPTGLAVLPEKNRLFVVDTEEQQVRIFTLDGEPVGMIDDEGGARSMLYPTFARAFDDETVLINDGLNYKVRRFDADGRHLLSFGSEGTGPGTFARPKGMAADSEGHIYVVDNLFDNVQVFDPTGRLLLVIGGPGQDPGQFWSPAGIDIDQDTVFIADTYNNRVQVLHYLGGN